MNRARLHTVYLYLLNECLELDSKHREQLKHVWKMEDIDCRELMIKSIPSEVRRIIVLPEVAKTFDYDLRGVPGFYYDSKKDYPLNWRINLPEEGLVRPYYMDGRIVGLFVYENARDTKPGLLSSHGLSFGTQAIQPHPRAERKLAA